MVGLDNRVCGGGCARRAAALRASIPRLAGVSFRAALSFCAALSFSAALACSPSAPPAAPSAPPDDESDGSAVPTESAPETPEAADDQSPSVDEQSPPAAGSDEATPSGDDGLDADIAALSASTQTAPATAAPSAVKPASGAEGGGREIVYRVTPKGLVIEIDGIHLRPEAKPFKDKNGAYGIQIVVNAESFDGRQYRVNKPKEGPLSIAGKVESQGKSARFVDEREGSAEETVVEGSPRRFEQRWPGRGQPKLWAGETVTLEVGLWGVRAETERERPVRRLFVVKMVAGPRSQAVITPPTMDWGT